ncbi:MAG: pilus assembly protein PilY [Proteobacteria bacterium]|nr:pilus assembly protein PilY [Pseudomonadota bacterium]
MNLNKWTSLVSLAALAVIAVPRAALAQSVAEDFTGSTTTNSWYSFNGACLTAGTGPATSPGSPPGCTYIRNNPKPLGYGAETLVGGYAGVAGGTTQTLPDPVGNGALRFTNGYPNGNNESGAIVSSTPFPTGQGVSITFKTVTYRGDSGSIGNGFTFNDGADGISFFLMDATQSPNIGSYGGSLGYSCSNSNSPYTGMVGAYVGLGIDEYGNFLNGVNLMPGYTGSNSAGGDNSALGYGRHPNRIGMRGAGNVAWPWLYSNYYLSAYPATIFTTAQQNAAVQATCKTGIVADPVNPSNALLVGGAKVSVLDYAPIPNAYVELPSSTKIANESAISRKDGVPIFYSLRITGDGRLSLSYSINGGAYQKVITGQSITASNGPLPANFLFGFAGSTGGSTNIHEILCFKADPATTASGSAGASEKQSAKLETGAQAYFAFYNPSTWSGRVTASGLGLDTYGNVIIAATPNWDAACTLSGIAATSTCPTTGVAGPVAAYPTAPNRNILSWSGTSGIPFLYGSLTSSPSGGQQAVINSGDVSPLPACNASTAYTTDQRVNYLRGDQSCELNSSGVGRFRARTDLLGDIVDSSPTWVGPPIAPYAVTWVDRLRTATMPEAAGTAQTYASYINAAQTRMNVVYVGANDGLLHGFRSGYYDANGNFVATGNDGAEVLAYLPGSLMGSIHQSTTNLDFPNIQYGHNFYVDATPGTGDVFYGGTWHTWLVGGLGIGGQAIYALDVSTPSGFAQTSAAASAIVKGEWNNTSITCVNSSTCGTNLGYTFGTPQLRRLHDGKWAAIFGNGFNSSSGDGGIFIMTIDPTTAALSFYYLSTGTTGGSNGIAFASPADLDGDHITDYVYAGDLQGSVWRFDLTSASESTWTSTAPVKLYKGSAAQPITTALVLASGAASTGSLQQLMVLFGTGQKVNLTATTPTTYSSGTQTLYGVWDWNMASWNSQSAATYASLTTTQAGTLGLTASNVQKTNLQGQTVTINATTLNRDIANNATPCWANTAGCTTSSTAKFGWYIDLPGTQEQVIYSPELVAQALTVNTIVPALNAPTSCNNLADTGYTYVVSALTGAAFTQVFLPPSEAANPNVNTNPRYTDTNAIAMQTNATGSSFITGNNAGTKFLVYETNQTQVNGAGILGGTLGLNLPTNTTGKRVSWIQRR